MNIMHICVAIYIYVCVCVCVCELVVTVSRNMMLIFAISYIQGNLIERIIAVTLVQDSECCACCLLKF
jgi:hypothetical protein